MVLHAQAAAARHRAAFGGRFPCGYTSGLSAAKAANKPSYDLGSGAGCGVRRACPAKGGANWAKAQFTAVIIPYQETAKAVSPPRSRRKPAAAG